MPTLPDGYFYYTLTVLLGGVLVGIVYRYTNKIDETFKEIRNAVNELVTSMKVHNVRLDGHDREIEEIKDGKYIVKYPNPKR